MSERMPHFRWIVVPALALVTLCWAGCALWPVPEHYDTYPAPLPGRPPAAPEAGPWAAGVHLDKEGPLKLNVEDSILLALDNNPQYRVHRYKPEITRTERGRGARHLRPEALRRRLHHAAPNRRSR